MAAAAAAEVTQQPSPASSDAQQQLQQLGATTTFYTKRVADPNLVPLLLAKGVQFGAVRVPPCCRILTCACCVPRARVEGGAIASRVHCLASSKHDIRHQRCIFVWRYAMCRTTCAVSCWEISAASGACSTSLLRSRCLSMA